MRSSGPPRTGAIREGWQTPKKAPASLTRSLPLTDRTNAAPTRCVAISASASTSVASASVPVAAATSAAAAAPAAASATAAAAASSSAGAAQASSAAVPQPVAAHASQAQGDSQQQQMRVERAACRLLEKVVAECADRGSSPEQVFAPIFHSVSVPGISGGDYLVQHLLRLGLARKEHLSEAVVLHAFLLIDRLLQTNSGRGFHLCTRNVHRVLLATTLISAKLLDDECYNNTYWASVGGVSLPHLNQLEIEVVSLLDFNLLVTASALDAARKRLLDSSSA